MLTPRPVEDSRSAPTPGNAAGTRVTEATRGKETGGTKESQTLALRIDEPTIVEGTARFKMAEFLRKSPNVELVLSLRLSVDATSSRTSPRLPIKSSGRAIPRRQRSRRPNEIVATLRDALPAPIEQTRVLAARRLEVTRDILVRNAGIETDRLSDGPTEAEVDDPGPGRVELDLGS